MKTTKNTKNTKKNPFAMPLIAAFVALVGIVIVVYSPLAAFWQADNTAFITELDARQADNTAFITELNARQAAVINLARTWVAEELGFNLQTQPVSFDSRLSFNDSTPQSEIWWVEITNPLIRRVNATPRTDWIARLNIDRITGDITARGTSFHEHEIYVNGANITVRNLTAIGTAFPEREVYVDGANITINELQARINQQVNDHIAGGGTLPATDFSKVLDITEVAAIVAAEITQKFAANLDGASFIMAFTGDFWTINVLLNPEQVRVGELPHIAPDFHALFDVGIDLTRNVLVSLTDF
ncbi:MAG: hypothetical protein FWG68_01835 [Defluviitaleaceae bacterium]|nr:hypothetical protein [Defluviitaleaceae bacterium]